MPIIKDSKLSKQSIELSVEAIGFYNWLIIVKKEYVMSKQILRSITSIGANIHEAFSAFSKADFIYKMQIALKESSETEYWLIILDRTGYLDVNFADLKAKNESLKKMLIAALKTAKN